MILPCEVAVKSVVPAVKALIARELVEKHSLKQGDAAAILGISQSAVSKYSRRVRGYAVEVNKTGEIQSMISSMISLLLDGAGHRTEFMELFCETCMAVRKTSLMCAFCQKSDPRIKIEDCGFCVNRKAGFR